MSNMVALVRTTFIYAVLGNDFRVFETPIQIEIDVITK